MSLLLAFIFFLILPPLKAWSYFDPGFGGYLVNSITSLIVTGLAFLSAAVIYFFRTIIGQKTLSLWHKHKHHCRTIIFVVLILASFFLGAFLYLLIHQSFFFILLQFWSYFDSFFGKVFGCCIILSFIIGIALIPSLIIYWQRYRKIHSIILISTTLLIYALLGATLFGSISKISPLLCRGPRTTIFDSHRIFNGYNLYNGKLIDEKGRIIKTWFHDYLGIIDKNGDYYGENHDYNNHSSWGRYTWDEKVIWEKHFFIHHELYLSPQGTIFTFSQESHDYNNYKVNFDTILEFDKNGRQLQRYSLWDHLKEFQPYHAQFGIDATFFPGLALMLLWQNYFQGNYDYFHINSFYLIPPNPLEDKNPAFRRGNWLISIFHGSMVFILDKTTKRILWHAVGDEIKGGLQGQHSASMLPDGNILLFDNGVNRRASRILIIDPITLKIKWQFKNKGFFSPIEGFVQALPNNDLLITESKKGHAFEITPDKKIVWECYDTSNRDGDIYRMTRYPKKIIDNLLHKWNPS